MSQISVDRYASSSIINADIYGSYYIQTDFSITSQQHPAVTERLSQDAG